LTMRLQNTVPWATRPDEKKRDTCKTGPELVPMKLQLVLAALLEAENCPKKGGMVGTAIHAEVQRNG